MTDITYLQLCTTLISTATFYGMLTHFAETTQFAPIGTIIFCCGVVYMYKTMNYENEMMRELIYTGEHLNSHAKRTF